MRSGPGGTQLVAGPTQCLRPEASCSQMPLLQSMPEGTIVFDLQNGRLLTATLKSNRELKNHQGEGSSYRFVSSYTEQFVSEK